MTFIWVKWTNFWTKSHNNLSQNRQNGCKTDKLAKQNSVHICSLTRVRTTVNVKILLDLQAQNISIMFERTRYSQPKNEGMTLWDFMAAYGYRPWGPAKICMNPSKAMAILDFPVGRGFQVTDRFFSPNGLTSLHELST